MRCTLIATALTLVATASLASPVVTENLSGTISGSNTVDKKGYFGKAGADLSGAKVAIYIQYVPTLLGPSMECRNNNCTYNTSVQMLDTQGSLLVTVTINGTRVVYSPTYEGAIFFNTNAPYQLTVDSDAFSGFGIGLRGLQLATQFKAAPIFGHPLSPGNGPVLRASSSNYIAFFNANDQVPVENLSYIPTAGSK